MKRFWLNRKVDESGVSGTGVVAEGVIFSNGKVALCWRTVFSSIAIYDSIELVQHIHGHNGSTEIVYEGG